MDSTTYTIHEIRNGIFHTRVEMRRNASEQLAVEWATSVTRQPEDLVREALSFGPTGNFGGAIRIPANSRYDGAGCIDLTPEAPEPRRNRALVERGPA